MDLGILQKLTATELDQYGNELDHALEHHTQWLARINRALVFGEDISPHDIQDDPHLECHFGRWYHSLEDTTLHDVPQFAAIGPVHERLHGLARDILLKRLHRRTLFVEQYDAFVHEADELRRLMQAVRLGMKQNMGIASRLMAKVFENAKEGVVITGTDGRILNVNRAFTEVTGYTAEEVMGQTPQVLNSGRQTRSYYEEMWATLAQEGQWQGEIWNRRKNGDIYLEWLSISAVKSEHGQVTHYIGIFSDITNEKENEERLYHLAHYDPLTELPNRVLFQDRFKQALARARRNGRKVAVMFLDLDGFKGVNDTFGHASGDALLGQVASRLLEQLRTTDTVARLGGDEFAVILPDMDDLRGLEGVAAKVIGAIALPFVLAGGQNARISTSIGISLYPDHGLDADDLIQHADTAMYEAKQRGKNRYCFYIPEMG